MADESGQAGLVEQVGGADGHVVGHVVEGGPDLGHGVAEFLRGEFYHREFDAYRQDFKHLVEQADLDDPQENFIRRALLFRRRGRLWRELPPGMQWWEVELTASDLARLRSFPRNDWRRFAGGGFYLSEMIGRIQAELTGGQPSRFLGRDRYRVLGHLI